MEGRQNGWIKYARPNTLAYFGAVLVAKCQSWAEMSLYYWVGTEQIKACRK